MIIRSLHFVIYQSTYRFCDMHGYALEQGPGRCLQQRLLQPEAPPPLVLLVPQDKLPGVEEAARRPRLVDPGRGDDGDAPGHRAQKLAGPTDLVGDQHVAAGHQFVDHGPS